MQDAIQNIANLVTYKQCPLCQGSFEHLGPIASSGVVHFSSHQINLERQPELSRCRSCRSGLTQNAIPADVALQLYSQGKGSERWQSKKAFDQLKSKSVIENLNRYFLSGRRVLDIGCNTGELLDLARMRGCQTFGVEPSEDGRAIAQKKQHHVLGSMSQLEGVFDVITAFDLIEHVYDVNATIKEFLRLLAPGGTMILFTGNIECRAALHEGPAWWYVQFPEHVVFPSPTYFKSIPGLKVLDIVPTFAEKRLEPRFVRGTYNILRGRPLANLPDHILVILQANRGTP